MGQGHGCFHMLKVGREERRNTETRGWNGASRLSQNVERKKPSSAWELELSMCGGSVFNKGSDFNGGSAFGKSGTSIPAGWERDAPPAGQMSPTWSPIPNNSMLKRCEAPINSMLKRFKMDFKSLRKYPPAGLLHRSSGLAPSAQRTCSIGPAGLLHRASGLAPSLQ